MEDRKQFYLGREGQAASLGTDNALSIVMWIVFLVAGLFVIGLLVKRLFFS